MQDGRRAEEAASGRSSAPGVYTSDVHLSGRRRGIAQWELRARRLDVPEPRREVEFEDVTDGVFYRDGAPWLRFEGDGGRFDEASGRLILDGAFVLSHEDAEFKGRDLVWDATEEVLSTNRPVVVRREATALRAGAMALHVKTGVVEFSGGVDVDGPNFSVTVPAVDYYPDTGAVEFAGPVEIAGGAP